MKGRVFKRGKTYTYVFDAPADTLTGERKQVTKGGWRSEAEAWSACRDAMKLAEDGKHVKASGRTVASYLTDEWLPRIRNATAATSTLLG